MAIFRRRRRLMVISLVFALFAIPYICITTKLKNSPSKAPPKVPLIKQKFHRKNLKILVVILSNASNIENRDNIRSTWGSPRSLKQFHGSITKVFAIRHSSDSLQRNVLKSENSYHSDIVFYSSSSKRAMDIYELGQFISHGTFSSRSHFLLVGDDLMVNTHKIIDLAKKYRKFDFVTAKKVNGFFDSSVILFGGPRFPELLDKCFAIEGHALKKKLCGYEILLLDDPFILPNIVYEPSADICGVQNFTVLANLTLPKMKALQKALDLSRKTSDRCTEKKIVYMAMVFSFVMMVLFLVILSLTVCSSIRALEDSN